MSSMSVAYTEENGVDAERRTETFAEVHLELDNWRWAGTLFRLRTVDRL
jgi:glucose-6-phosphate 1-dehydrogenase